ncbi:hypothetical protein BJX63DRAFT_266059 [Aspergillus granulosus]|uniref:Uncharacterized protein n=1 Tax=Aspergillus granulosus TaxID=176169 RepID=A0ABR4H8Y0_9EURO
MDGRDKMTRVRYRSKKKAWGVIGSSVAIEKKGQKQSINFLMLFLVHKLSGKGVWLHEEIRTAFWAFGEAAGWEGRSTERRGGGDVRDATAQNTVLTRWRVPQCELSWRTSCRGEYVRADTNFWKKGDAPGERGRDLWCWGLGVSLEEGRKRGL